jgi:hypothetical protein
MVPAHGLPIAFRPEQESVAIMINDMIQFGRWLATDDAAGVVPQVLGAALVHSQV